jgi:hypothetical protein
MNAAMIKSTMRMGLKTTSAARLSGNQSGMCLSLWCDLPSHTDLSAS